MNTTHPPAPPKHRSLSTENGYHERCTIPYKLKPTQPGPPLAPDYICKRLCPLGQIWRGYGQWTQLSKDPYPDYWARSRKAGQAKGCAPTHTPTEDSSDA